MSQMWKLLKKLWLKTGISLPTSKKNHKGKIVSGAEELKLLMAKEYKQRLRTSPIRPDLKSMGIRKNRIFQLKIKLAQKKKSPDWTMSDLNKVLSKLNNNKSRDFQGYINEIFKPNVIGDEKKKDDCEIHELLQYNNCAKKGIQNSIEE